MIRLRPNLLILCALSILVVAGRAHAGNRSDLEWQTLETDHFQVHFHQGTEGTARRAAAIAEEIYPAITGLYNYEPKQLTHLIILDTDDYANGAAFYYDDKIEIWATALEFELRGTHTWLRDVITHEYTHIISLQAAQRMPHFMPSVYLQGFGYEEEKRQDVLIGYPNIIYSYPWPGTMMAAWFAEGVSQYQTRSVYNDWWDTHRDMLLRMAALDGTLLTYDQMGGFGGTGLESEMIYNQGHSLVRFIADRYGEEALEEITAGLKSIWRLDMDGAFKSATGKDGGELYAEWKEAITADYQRLATEMAPRSIEGTTVSDGGYLNLYPAWQPETAALYWASNRGRDYGQLTLVKLEAGALRMAQGDDGGATPGEPNRSDTPEPVASGISTPLAMSADGKLAFYSKRTDENPHGSRVNDIYVLDTAKDKEDRLTKSLRAKDPAISPDGRHIAAIVNGDGTNQVVILDRGGQLLRTLTQSAHGTQYYTPRWSPDGTSLLLCTFRGLSRDILLMDAETGAEQMLVETPADERDPCYIPGENAILYASDRTGIFNIYRRDLASGAVTQVTNLIGGAFYPAVSADGTLAMSAFTGPGYEVRVLPRAEWGQDVVPDTPSDPRGDYRLATAGPTALRFDQMDGGFSGEATRYDLSYPVTHFMPRLILDNGRPRLGFYMASNEILDKQSFYAGGAVGRRFGGFEFELSGGYENRQLPVTVLLDAYRVRRRDVNVEEGQIVAGAGVPHGGEIRPIKFETRYDLVEADAGLRYEWGDRYSLTYWKNLTALYTYQDYNINFFATDDIDGSFYGKDGWSYYKGHIASTQFDYRKVERAMDSDVNPRGGRTVMARAAYTWAGLNPSGVRSIEDFQPVYEDNDFGEIEFDWREHVGMPWGRHTLELRARGGFIHNTEVDDFFHYAVGSQPGLRGYTYFSAQGRKLGIGGVTYRFPIIRRLDKQVSPLLVHRIYGGVFYEAGNVWNDSGLEGLSVDRLLSDVGFELRIDMTSFYSYPAAFYLEGARGVSGYLEEQWRFYSGLLFSF